jgi:hypothetical protein
MAGALPAHRRGHPDQAKATVGRKEGHRGRLACAGSCIKCGRALATKQRIGSTRWLRGEPKRRSIAAIPTLEDEDPDLSAASVRSWSRSARESSTA